MPSSLSYGGVAALLLSAAAAQSSSQLPASCSVQPSFPTEIPQYKVTSPEKFPSPVWNGQGSQKWVDAYAKARQLVSQLTLLEKVNLTTGTGWQSEGCVGTTGGVPRLGIDGLCLQDSPLGVRFGQYSSAFPAGVTIGATWDKDLFYKRGFAMGTEHRMKGVNILLGPVSGPIGMFPNGGRGWEGSAADPYLSGIALAQGVSGIQDAGVIACAKHFVGNEQEHFRQAGESCIKTNESSSSNIDDRTMHEVLAWPFADAIRAGVGAIMCSYNRVNNSYACSNSKLINGILKDEMGMPSILMSDWAAQHDGVHSALSGLDMTMPGDQRFNSGNSYFGGNLTVAVLNGTVPQYRLDDMVTRIMAAWYYVGQDKQRIPVNFNSWTTDRLGFEHFFAHEGYGLVNENVDVRGAHGALIREIGAKGTVLLKNEGALPLVSPKQIAVFGSDAADSKLGPNGCPDRGCAEGTIAMGWGSGTANFPYLISPLTALQNRAYQDNSVIQWNTDDAATNTTIASIASQATVCLAFVKADAGEGYITVQGNQGDRNDLRIWNNGDDLVKNVAASCNNTIVVIHGPGAVLVEDWIEHPNVTACLFAGMPGQESGNGLVDVLYGQTNPAGRLPFTMGKNESDYGVSLMFETDDYFSPQQDLSGGLFLDHRYFDKHDIEPRFEFGFGLSYTQFTYSNLQVTKVGSGAYTPYVGSWTPPSTNSSLGSPEDYLFPDNLDLVDNYIYPYLNSTTQYGLDGKGEKGPAAAYDTTPQQYSPAGGAPGGNPSLYETVYEVSFTITNTGKYNGDEVAQLYLSTGEPDSPVRVLRGFERISTTCGAPVTVKMQLCRRDLSIWDVAKQDWTITQYPKEIFVGGSSRKLYLNATLPSYY